MQLKMQSNKTEKVCFLLIMQKLLAKQVFKVTTLCIQRLIQRRNLNCTLCTSSFKMLTEL